MIDKKTETSTTELNLFLIYVEILNLVLVVTA
jgi:hypothetical protein